jgi:hypothetical protein
MFIPSQRLQLLIPLSRASLRNRRETPLSFRVAFGLTGGV